MSGLELWLLSPDALRRWAREAAGLLSPGERERAAALRDPGARERALGRRAFLRGALAAFSGKAPAALDLGRGEGGKPRGEGLEFNLSESDGWTLLGLGERPLGVDLERLQPESAWRPVCERYFGPAEAQRLGALPPEERDAGFFRRWTQAEALLKLDGCGLEGLERLGPRIELARARQWVLDLDLGPGLAAAVAQACAPRHWRLRQGPLPGGDFLGRNGSSSLQRG